MKNQQKIKKGDHIFFETQSGFYHHGIYWGYGYAIHFDGHTKTINKSSLSDFTKPLDISCIQVIDYRNPWSNPWKLFNPRKLFNRNLWRLFQYFLIYKFSKLRALNENTVIERAESLLGKSQYHFGSRNCEHFAVWCKTGKWQSLQVMSPLNSTTKILMSSTVATYIIPSPYNWIILLLLVLPLGIALTRGSKPPKV